MTQPTPEPGHQHPTARVRRTPAVGIAVAIVLIGAALAGGMVVGASAGDTDPPTTARPSAVDIGFARDMKAHHAQAVQMSVLVRDRTSDRAVRNLALDIELSQQQQIGQMYGWLELWGKPQASTGPRMAWIPTGGSGSDASHRPAHGSQTSGSSMPGMASTTDLRRLERLRGDRAERLFLQLMIPHHQAGVDMARAAVRRANVPEVRDLARAIITSQSAEIRALRELLRERGGPVPG